jgi:hypothetical protein
MSKCLSCGTETENRRNYCTACLVISAKGKYAGTSLADMIRQMYPKYFRPGWVERKQMTLDVLEG